jgi:hypothetical protein
MAASTASSSHVKQEDLPKSEPKPTSTQSPPRSAPASGSSQRESPRALARPEPSPTDSPASTVSSSGRSQRDRLRALTNPTSQAAGPSAARDWLAQGVFGLRPHQPPSERLRALANPTSQAARPSTTGDWLAQGVFGLRTHGLQSEHVKPKVECDRMQMEEDQSWWDDLTPEEVKFICSSPQRSPSPQSERSPSPEW